MKYIKLFLIGLLITASGLLQHSHAQIGTPKTDNAIHRLADFVGDDHHQLIEDLRGIGYDHPGITNDRWAGLSAQQKIEVAYRCAIPQPEGGEKMLALLSQSMAQEYDPLKHSEDIRPYREMHVDGHVEYRPATSGDLRNLLLHDELYEDVIESSSTYIERTDLENILTRQLGLSQSETSEIISTSTSNKEALRKGLSKISSVDEQKGKLSNIITDIQKNYESARYERSFNSFMQQTSPSVRPIKAISSEYRATELSIDKLPEAATGFNKTRTYSAFFRESYINVASAVFSAMTHSAGGFGGVIFGSPVKKDAGLPKLDSLKWIADDPTKSDNTAYGTLEFKYHNGEVRFMRNVLLEDLVASYDVLLGQYDSVTKYRDGRGIGLGGITYGQNSRDRGVYLDYLNREKRAVVLHPAVANLSLGWSIIYTDIGTIINKALLVRLKSEDEKALLARVFKRFGDWKVVDVPVKVSFKNTDIILSRLNGSQHNNVYISMVGLPIEGSEYKTDTTSFDSIAPILIKNNYNYKRLNDFAKVLLVLRYAKKDGAVFFKKPKYKDWVIQPHYIALDSTGVKFDKPDEEGMGWKQERVKWLRLLGTMNRNLGLWSQNEFDSIALLSQTLGKVRLEEWNLTNSYYYGNTKWDTLQLNYEILTYYEALVSSKISEQLKEAKKSDTTLAAIEDINQEWDTLEKQTREEEKTKCPRLYQLQVTSDSLKIEAYFDLNPSKARIAALRKQITPLLKEMESLKQRCSCEDSLNAKGAPLAKRMLELEHNDPLIMYSQNLSDEGKALAFILERIFHDKTGKF